ncbi:formin-like protein 5 [Phyllostomus discolor]|uniref:Formin-like protein 5 n=1 Tax=Phyllostomus discolor TaxID=89673 RepID=A0A7E6D224_9CHIR|nr:formin-like protein 5 [Phyllostomus discolor]
MNMIWSLSLRSLRSSGGSHMYTDKCITTFKTDVQHGTCQCLIVPSRAFGTLRASSLLLAPTADPADLPAAQNPLESLQPANPSPRVRSLPALQSDASPRASERQRQQPFSQPAQPRGSRPPARPVQTVCRRRLRGERAPPLPPDVPLSASTLDLDFYLIPPPPPSFESSGPPPPGHPRAARAAPAPSASRPPGAAPARGGGTPPAPGPGADNDPFSPRRLLLLPTPPPAQPPGKPISHSGRQNPAAPRIVPRSAGPLSLALITLSRLTAPPAAGQTPHSPPPRGPASQWERKSSAPPCPS